MANKSKNNSGWLVKMGESLTRVSEKYMPDPAIFAILLTVVVYVISLLVMREMPDGTKYTPLQGIIQWYSGFWELIGFAMQMAIVVITGGVLADTKLVKGFINKIAAIPKDGRQGAAVVAFVAIFVSYINYGLSTVVGALVARNITYALRKKGKPVEYRLLSAAAYLGLMTWSAGLSSSIGLTGATAGAATNYIEQATGNIVTMGEFMFNPMNIFVAIALITIIPALSYFLHPVGDAVQDVPEYALASIELAAEQEEEVKIDRSKLTPGEKLNHSPIIGWFFGGFGMVYIVWHFATKGFALDLNVLNAIFIFVSLILHGTIAKFVDSFGRATSNVSGIIFQFPLYAGILGIIRGSGLGVLVAQGIANFATPQSYFVLTFFIAGVLNFFIPSGGGQWAIQGPIAVQSATSLAEQAGVDTHHYLTKASLAVAYGDAWSNMAQPFWALAVLGITGLKARDIMGYCMALMIFAMFIYVFGLAFLPV